MLEEKTVSSLSTWEKFKDNWSLRNKNKIDKKIEWGQIDYCLLPGQSIFDQENIMNIKEPEVLIREFTGENMTWGTEWKNQ